MARTLLTLGQILELSALLKQNLAFLEVQRAQNPLAKMIKRAQVPSQLSESLALHLLQGGLLLPMLSEYSFSFGGDRSDILATKANEILPIEIKATNEKGFQRLSKKDHLATYIIWIHFGNYFLPGSDGRITLYTIPSPHRFFQPRQEISIPKLHNIVGKDLVEESFSLSDFLNGVGVELERKKHAVQTLLLETEK